MKAYTAQEWQIKFKEQAGNNKQQLHDLSCTALVRLEDVQTVLHWIVENHCADCEDNGSLCDYCSITDARKTFANKPISEK